MDPLCRFEPVGNELLDIEPKSSELIEKISWDDFFLSFNGNHTEVTQQFSLYLKGNVSQIGDLRLVITEDLIEKDTKLLQKGER